MNETRFFIGDRVRLLRHFPEYGLVKGRSGLVWEILESENGFVYTIIFKLGENNISITLPQVNSYNNENFQKVQPKPEPTEIEALRQEISRLKAQVDLLEKTQKPEKKPPFKPTIGKLVYYVAPPGDLIKWKTGDIIEPIAYRTRKDNGVEVLICWNVNRGEAAQRALNVYGKELFKPLGE